MDRDELNDILIELTEKAETSDIDYAIKWLKDELNITKADEFMEKVKGQKIVDVNIVEGDETMGCGKCQFEFELDSGYSFVG